MQNTSNLWPKLASAFLASQVLSFLYYMIVLALAYFDFKVSLSLTLYQTSLFVMAASAIGILFYELWNRYLNK